MVDPTVIIIQIYFATWYVAVVSSKCHRYLVQILKSTLVHMNSIDPSHKSKNASVPYPTMQHYVTEMCTCVHIYVTKWCIVGYLSDALWGLWDGSIGLSAVKQKAITCANAGSPYLCRHIASLGHWALALISWKLKQVHVNGYMGRRWVRYWLVVC